MKQETYSGAQKVLEYSMDKQKREAQARQAQAAEEAQQLQAANNEAMLKKEALVQSGQDNREDIKADAKKETAFINKIPSPQQGQA